MNYDSKQIDKNDEDADLAEERELLASLIEKLKCEIDETKNRNTILETSNKVLVEKLKSEIGDFKNKNKSLTQANYKLSKENDLLYADYKKSNAELKRCDSIEYATKIEIECAKVKGDFLSYKMESQKSCTKYNQTIIDLNQTSLEMKNKLSAHQDTISTLKQQKDAHIKLYKSREDKEIEKVIDLENKVNVLDNIVYKTGQTVQTMNMLNNKCRTSFIKLEYLKKAKQANPRLYDIGCYNDNLTLMLSPESDEVIRLEKESRSKLSDLIRPFDYAKLNSLYDLFVSQREKSSEQCFILERSRVSHITIQKEKKSFNKQPTLLEKRLDQSIPLGKQCRSSLELFNIPVQATTIFNEVEMCKNSITKSTYFGYLDPFIKNAVEQKFSPEIERILNGLNQFKRCLKVEMVADLRYFNSLEFEVDSLRSQLESQKTQFSNEIDRLSKEYYNADHMNAILCVYTEFDEVTNMQCDYLELLQKCECLEIELSKRKMMSKSFESVQKHAINLELELQQCKEKVKNDMSFKVNKSKDFCKEREQYFEIQDLKAQLQDKGIVIRVIPTTSVSRPQLKSSPMGDKVLRSNSRGKKLEVEEHRRNVKLSKNKTSVTACNDSLNAKTLNSKSVSVMCDKCLLIDKHDMKIYECVSKTCSWWYPKFTPSGYIWKPKFGTENVNLNLIEIVLFIVDSGCSKHMTGNLKLLINFVEKFLGTVKFGNDQIARILKYGDLVQGAVMIKRVYYVEGLNHNLFSVGQFCNADLEVAFRKSTCFIRDLKGNDLLTGDIVSSMVMASSSISFELRHHQLPVKE
nr:integrase, catalytic region, zinc finger, CCHC-type, peptidase aspartic, catalytic [Tanacetum cinerariifolium]